MKIIDFDPNIHEIKFNGKQESVLTETNISLLKRMFHDGENYQYYMKTLWLLRSLAAKKCDKDGNLNTKDDAYPIFRLTNELIGCLLRDDTFFDDEGNLMTRFDPNEYR